MHKYKKSLLKLYRQLRCTLLGGCRILVLGDSHTGVFEYIFDHDLLSPHLINCEVVGGATAGGLNNDHSLTGAFKKYQAALKRFHAYRVVAIMLGEVDCSYTAWQRTANASPCAQIPHAIRGIERLLDWAQSDDRQRQFILAGAILPTVKDHQIDLQSQELRRTVRASQRQRSELVLAFNAAVKALAIRRQLAYIEITTPTLDPQRGVISDQFLVQEQIDHHQSQAMTAGLWVHELRPVLASLPRQSR